MDFYWWGGRKKNGKKDCHGLFVCCGREGGIKTSLRDAVCSPKFERKAKVDPRTFCSVKKIIQFQLTGLIGREVITRT